MSRTSSIFFPFSGCPKPTMLSIIHTKVRDYERHSERQDFRYLDLFQIGDEEAGALRGASATKYTHQCRGLPGTETYF